VRKGDLPEEDEIHNKFRELRNNLKKKIKAFDDADLQTDEVSSAIKYQYGILARLEEELDLVPTDESIIADIEENSELTYEGKVASRVIDEKEYQRLVKQLKRLEKKVSRVSILNDLGKNARLLTQNITSQAQINELEANTKRIELTTHQASLLALSKMFYLALRKLGYSGADLEALARKMKQLEVDYPLVQTNYAALKSMLFAEPAEMSNIIDAEFEEANGGLQAVNQLVSGRKARKRK